MAECAIACGSAQYCTERRQEYLKDRLRECWEYAALVLSRWELS